MYFEENTTLLKNHPTVIGMKKKVAKFDFSYIQVYIQVKWKQSDTYRNL